MSMMAGIHFIILKVNDVDVSQMTHEEAIQMFLKASEPIVVEVRRQSYNVESIESIDWAGAQVVDDIVHSNESSCSKRQLPVFTHMTTSQTVSTDKHHDSAHDSSNNIVDSLKFHSLVISPNFDSQDVDNSAKEKVAPRSNESMTVGNITHSASSPSYCISNGSNPYNSSPISPNSLPTKTMSQKTPESSSFGETNSKLETETVNGGKKLVSIGTQTDDFTTDLLFNGPSMINANHMIESEHNFLSDCMAPEIDIEEITLRKSDSNERLGLTVCYSSGGGNGSGSDDTDTCTEVYISDIVPDSIAGRDGRLRQGDQILQVNGTDVLNREETETLIAENSNVVTLLVSRYLYGDDDEFNEQGDFYDDESNMTYTNCFLNKYVINENMSKLAKENNTETSPETTVLVDDTLKVDPDFPVSGASVPLITSQPQVPTSKDPLNHTNIRAHLDEVNQEIAILDSRVENMMPQHNKPTKSMEPTLNKNCSTSNCGIALQILDYDTEHIYETIPEDSESEPLYCSPYEENSVHRNQIEQWLGLHDKSQNPFDEPVDNKSHILQQKNQHLIQNPESVNIWTKTKSGTIRSTNSSAGDDHENSSSAYNTGGSCNSNTMTPLTLEFNTSYCNRDQHSPSTLVLCPAKNAVSPFREVQIHQPVPTQDFTDSIKSSHRFSKEKLASPTHSTKFSQISISKQKPFALSSISDMSKCNNQNTPISITNTMYTNVTNLQQTMLLQQQLLRQSLIHQRLPVNPDTPCPQFTAPNLSQYHFVSSQEVSTVKLNTHPSEDHMVWKVKRRQDGTRYIVRRPARTRFLRNRALRISAERNDHTTEDDTISEIKTGRYWTKEERKKHIERARERRQRQQIIISNKNSEALSAINHASSGAQSSAQTNNTEVIIAPTFTTASAKVQRQCTQSGQNTIKKLTRKLTNNPVEFASSTPGNGSAKSTSANGSKVAGGLLSVTTV